MISRWASIASRRASTPWGVGFWGSSSPTGSAPWLRGLFWVTVQSSAR